MKNVPLSAIISIIAGIIILLVPQIINYAVGLYLIIMGVMQWQKDK